MMKIRKYLSLVKFSHTVFALPFALIGYALAIGGGNNSFSFSLFGLVLLCMVFARNAAMAFNRYIDKEYDKSNPRTASREIPSKQIGERSAILFILANSCLFILTTYFINTICFYLSPIALLVVLGYSYTKRFTFLCHFVLGLGLSLAPIGASLAVAGEFAFLPILFSVVVLFWVSGFDIIYALQDAAFDKEENLKSVPVLLGKKNALILSRVLHAIAAIFVLIACYFSGNGLLFLCGAVVFVALLVYQHSLVKADDLKRVNLAFFTTNGIAGVVFAAFVIADIIVAL